MMLTGENGILNRAGEARDKTGKSQIIDIARIDISAKQTEKQGNITEEELEEILTSSEYNTNGTLSDEEFILDRTLTSSDGKYKIPVKEIWSGEFSSEKDDGLYHFWVDDYEFSCTPGETWEEWISRFDGKYGLRFSLFRGMAVQVEVDGITRGVGVPGDNVPIGFLQEIEDGMHYYIGADLNQIS